MFFYKLKNLTRQAAFFAIIFISSFFIFSVPFCLAAPTQAELEQELKNIEEQIAQYSSQLAKTSTEKNTLQNKIKQLQTKQKTLNLQIKSTTLQLNKLTGQIGQIQEEIKTSQSKEESLKKQMAIIIKQINSVDNNIIISLLGAEGITQAFNELQNYSELIGSLKNLREKHQTVRKKLALQKNDLEEKKDDTNSLLRIRSAQQVDLKNNLTEQNELLAVTKGTEANYQAILKDTQKRAVEIRNRIYELFNTGSQVTFGQAVEIAKLTSKLTGIRPAFILAVLTQESNLGKNVGTCNRVGDPPEKSWTVIMKPERDQEPFKQITTELGLDINTTPVSCPMKDKTGAQVGWGGAMGPAQFIPSTWMGYKNKIIALTGKSTANPWDIRDAFLAAAIKLRADGADGTEDGEWKAAMKYFAGSINLKYRFYGDNVLATAKKYETDITDLQ